MLKLLDENASVDIWVVDKSFNIGSAQDNQMVLQNETVDAHHARIVFDGKCHWLRDLGAPNGTYVNNQRINQRQIGDGDTLKIGDVTLKAVDPLTPGSQHSWCLVACSSWLSGKVYPLPLQTDTPLKLGRSEECDVIFQETHLAKVHVELWDRGDYLEVVDLNTRNGTFIDDTRITSGKLYPGQKLRLDIYSFMVFGPQVQPEGTPTLDITPQTPDEHNESIANKLSLIPSKDSPVPEKRWKTRPTSPGNRPGFEPSKKPQDSPWLKFAAISSMVILVALGIYILLG